MTEKPKTDDDRVCSMLTWKDVVQPLSVSEVDLDALIFAETDKH